MPTLEDRARTIIVEHLGVDADKVVDSASFTDDLWADSLDAIELVMAFKEEFGIEVPDDDIEKIETVGGALAYLKKATGGA